MAHYRAWTKADKKQLFGAVKGARSKDEAILLASKAFPKDAFTYGSLTQLLERGGYPTLGAILAKNRPNAPPPVMSAKTVAEDLTKLRLQDQVKNLEASSKQLLVELADREKQLEVLKGMRELKYSLKPVTAPKRVGATQRRGTPVMLCSDWHVEERVDPKTVNGLNEYNPQIAERCIERMADAFTWMTKDTRYDCREAVIWLGGDLYSGYIHDELAEGNFMSPTHACAWLLPRLEKMLRTIAKNCPSISRFLVPCNDGNHGRLTKKIRAATRTANSLEWFMYFNLAQRMRDDSRFEFQIADGVWNYLDLYGKTFGFLHGDVFRYLGGVGGLLIPVRRGLNEDRKYLAFGETPRRVDHVSMGHFHTRMDLDDISVNGSMIGITPYSMANHFPPEARKQSWFLVDSEYGKCISAPIPFK
jgi:hypothetical protein